jgi:hypothetical protein
MAVSSLGLGIGATTTMFSVVDGVLLRNLSYEDPGTLVNVWLTNLEWRGHPFFGDYWDRGPFDFSQYVTLGDATTNFRSVALHGEHTMTSLISDSTADARYRTLLMVVFSIQAIFPTPIRPPKSSGHR